MYSKSQSMPSIDGSTPPGGLSVSACESANQCETCVRHLMLGIHQKKQKHFRSQAVGKVAMDQSLSWVSGSLWDTKVLWPPWQASGELPAFCLLFSELLADLLKFSVAGGHCNIKGLTKGWDVQLCEDVKVCLEVAGGSWCPIYKTL